MLFRSGRERESERARERESERARERGREGGDRLERGRKGPRKRGGEIRGGGVIFLVSEAVLGYDGVHAELTVETRGRSLQGCRAARHQKTETLGASGRKQTVQMGG